MSTDADSGEQTEGLQYDRTYQLYKETDYLGQRKTLSLTYDTNMKIEVYAGPNAGEGEKLATFTVNGIDEIAQSDLLTKYNTTRPRVSLSFELSRTGLLLLSKAEAKVEETYFVEAPVNKTKAKKGNETADNTTASNETVEEQQPAAPTKLMKKRSHPYTLSRIERVIYGPLTLTKEQI